MSEWVSTAQRRISNIAAIRGEEAAIERCWMFIYDLWEKNAFKEKYSVVYASWQIRTSSTSCWRNIPYFKFWSKLIVYRLYCTNPYSLHWFSFIHNVFNDQLIAVS